jgi:hypothetical protein
VKHQIAIIFTYHLPGITTFKLNFIILHFFISGASNRAGTSYPKSEKSRKRNRGVITLVRITDDQHERPSVRREDYQLQSIFIYQSLSLFITCNICLNYFTDFNSHLSIIFYACLINRIPIILLFYSNSEIQSYFYNITKLNCLNILLFASCIKINFLLSF